MIQTILTVGGIAIAYSTGVVVGKKKKNKEESQSGKEQATLTKSEQEKQNRQKQIGRVLYTMDAFNNNKERFRHFNAVEADVGNVTYEYRDKDVLYTIYFEHNKFISLDITYKDESLLSFAYSLKHNQERMIKKELNNALFEHVHTEETIKRINKFLEIIISNPEFWGKISYSTVIKRNKSPEPEAKEETEIVISEQTEESTQEKRTVSEELQYIHNLIVKNATALESDMLQLFQQTLSKIEVCLQHTDNLETETRHLVEHLLQSDLQTLLSSYNELNADSKEEVNEKVQKALFIIHGKAEEITQLLEMRNLQEVEKAVQVIYARSY